MFNSAIFLETIVEKKLIPDCGQKLSTSPENLHKKMRRDSIWTTPRVIFFTFYLVHVRTCGPNLLFISKILICVKIPREAPWSYVFVFIVMI